MARQVTVAIHAIAQDGYPNLDVLTGRVAFIWDGHVVSGWPLQVDSDDRNSPFTGRWEAADNKLSSVREFAGVTHWIEFPDPVWDYEVAVDPEEKP